MYYNFILNQLIYFFYQFSVPCYINGWVQTYPTYTHLPVQPLSVSLYIQCSYTTIIVCTYYENQLGKT